MVHASTAWHRDDLHFQCGHPDRKGTGAAFEAALDRAFRDCGRAYTSGKGYAVSQKLSGTSIADGGEALPVRSRAIICGCGYRNFYDWYRPVFCNLDAVSQRKRALQTSYRDGIRGASRTCHRVVQRRSGSTACTISAVRGAVSGYEPGRTGTISGEGSTVPEACSCRRNFSCAASDLSRKDRYECKPDF